MMARFSLSNAEFLRKLNRACEYYLQSDVFNDLYTQMSISGASGYIVSPRGYGRIKGMVRDQYPQPIFNQFTQFIAYGLIGVANSQLWTGGLIDLGETCTQSEVWANGAESEGVLRIKCALGDVGKVVRFNGTYTDPDGRESNIWMTDGSRGYRLTTSGTTTTGGQNFIKVLDIQTETAFLAPWTLWKVVAGVETQIGYYEPNETRPIYPKYKLRPSTDPMRFFLKRVHVPLIYDSDRVRPDNINALEAGFRALTCEDNQDYKGADESWARGREILKAQFKELVPSPTIQLTDGVRGRAARGYPGAYPPGA